jgi:membrane glycosyltransferase
LLLAVPGVVAGAQPAWGQALRRKGLLLIPEETAPATELRQAWAGVAEAPGAMAAPINVAFALPGATRFRAFQRPRTSALTSLLSPAAPS